MGIAAYNRGSQVIARQIQRDYPVRPRAFEIMDRINALPKFGNDSLLSALKVQRVPFPDTVALEFSRGVWWMMDPDNMYEGHSRWYRSLEDAIRSWDIFLVGYNETTRIWTAKAVPAA